MEWRIRSRNGPLVRITEAAQSLADFHRSLPNRPDRLRARLYLLPLAGLDGPPTPFLAQLQSFCSAFFSMESTVLPPAGLSRAALTSRRHPATGEPQFLTTDLFGLVKRCLPGDGFAVLGVTTVDLYPDPNWNFVFGHASLRDRVGVCSLARFRSPAHPEATSPELLLHRACKLLAHEMCHMFGLAHCVTCPCLMNSSSRLEEVDGRPLRLCPVDLLKLQSSIGFPAAERDRQLVGFCSRSGLELEPPWTEPQAKITSEAERNEQAYDEKSRVRAAYVANLISLCRLSTTWQRRRGSPLPPSPR